MRRREAATTAVDEHGFGQRLKALRKRRSLTQAELAKKLGIHDSLIAQYEGGYIRLHAGLIVRLCGALGASPNEFLGVEEIKTDSLTKNRRLLRRLKRLDELPAADQRALLRFLDALLTRQDVNGRSKATARATSRSRRASISKIQVA